MRVKDIVSAEKTNVTCDQWQTGRMPKTLFPLSKSGKHSLNFRGGFEWCCVRFEALSCEFRLVIAINCAKQEFYAHLGMVCDKDMQMLASYEFHGTHPGWHVHAGCGHTDAIPLGRYLGPWKRRIPGTSKDCRRISWNVTKLNALEVACKAFGVETPPQEDNQGQMRLI